MSKCDKYKQASAGTAAVGAAAGAFTWGIGAIVGAVGAAGLEAKYRKCVEGENQKAAALEANGGVPVKKKKKVNALLASVTPAPAIPQLTMGTFAAYQEEMGGFAGPGGVSPVRQAPPGFDINIHQDPAGNYGFNFNQYREPQVLVGAFGGGDFPIAYWLVGGAVLVGYLTLTGRRR